MELDKLIVALVGLASVIFTYWFFLKKKERVIQVEDEVDILVDGGYNPSSISISKDRPTKINFIRKDSSSCLEEVVIADFKVRKFLPLNKKTTITITPKKAGEFGFECGMGMFHGKLIVK